MDEETKEEQTQEPKPEPDKINKMLRVTFWILVISCILLLGAWLGKLVMIGFS